MISVENMPEDDLSLKIFNICVVIVFKNAEGARGKTTGTFVINIISPLFFKQSV